MAWELAPDERAEMEEERLERNRLKKVWNASPYDREGWDEGDEEDDWRERLETDPDSLSESDCKEAVRWDGFLLDLVPMEKRTERVCAEAVESAWEALAYVPERLKTLDFCAVAAETAASWGADMSEDGEFMGMVPEGIRSDVLRMLAEKSEESPRP